MTGFRTSDAGNVATLFGLSLFVLLGVVAGAVDFSLALRAKSYADSAIDSAVLAAATAIRDDPKAWTNDKRAQRLADRTIRDYFASNVLDSEVPKGKLTVEVTRIGFDTVVKGTYEGRSPAAFLPIFDIDGVDIEATAAANAPSLPYIDITLIVDTSGSMALGATTADIDRLKAQFGCAFACHDDPGEDSYSWAVENGVKLRYDLVREAILNLADHLDSTKTGGRVQVQLYAFDDTLRRLSPLNASTNNLRKNLPTTPVTSSETAGGTRMWEIGPQIPDVVNKAGDGSTRGKAMQLVMMLTDGVQDPNRTWTWDLPLRDKVREFDVAFCDTVREKGALMGVVQVPYLEMTWDWGYNVTLDQPSLAGTFGAKRIDDVTSALKACGGDLYMRAETPDQITRSFESLLEQAVPTRLLE